MNTRLQYLFDRFLEKSCTAEEKQELMGLALEANMQGDVQQIISEAAAVTGDEHDMSDEKADHLMEQLFPVTTHEGLVIDGRKKFEWRRIAAAVALIILGTGAYFMFFNKKDKQDIIARTQEERFKNDVNPGSYKAKLKLADGREIILDSATIGELAKQGNTTVINKDGQLVYSGSGGEVLYNTVSTAKGETYSMTLADGSTIWLNSGSSIHFPVAFPGKERRIEVTGEVYVKVAKNKDQPFIASANGMEVLALGTEFNINAYADEASIRTTLIEGSVKINSSLVLKPGEQTQLAGGKLSAPKPVNVEEVTSWKDGFFHFESADLKSVLRQFARWYDVEVVYEGELTTDKFFVIISRSRSLASVLKALQAGGVKFEIEGKRLIVKGQ